MAGGGTGGSPDGRQPIMTPAVARAGLAAGAAEVEWWFWPDGEECEFFISQVTTHLDFVFVKLVQLTEFELVASVVNRRAKQRLRLQRVRV